ncbi:MAG: hypothetical protein S4CHLAM102_08930 [Chlamydiia bacterium]|nr:hypothetical protein [Chlamydiia bacterium]
MAQTPQLTAHQTHHYMIEIVCDGVFQGLMGVVQLIEGLLTSALIFTVQLHRLVVRGRPPHVGHSVRHHINELIENQCAPSAIRSGVAYVLGNPDYHYSFLGKQHKHVKDFFHSLLDQACGEECRKSKVRGSYHFTPIRSSSARR